MLLSWLYCSKPLFVLSTSIFLACFTINDSDIFENKVRGLEHTRAVTVLLLLFRIASAFTVRMCV